jgi:hypothetical protein
MVTAYSQTMPGLGDGLFAPVFNDARRPVHR